jgi:hypothetical protein
MPSLRNTLRSDLALLGAQVAAGLNAAFADGLADQVRIVERAMRLPVFATIVATPSATLPVAGTVHNTNTLLGHDGFVGVKTGSDDAAGGCFAFRAIRWIDGKRTTITGVVLGQPGYDLVEAGLGAAAAMVDRITGQRAVPELGQPTLPPLPARGSRRPRLRDPGFDPSTPSPLSRFRTGRSAACRRVLPRPSRVARLPSLLGAELGRVEVVRQSLEHAPARVADGEEALDRSLQ